MRSRVRVILNPASGGGAGRRHRGALERRLAELRVDYDIRATEGPGHAVELAREAAEQRIGTVIAAGGDGTVHEAANGLLGSRVGAALLETTLGVLPVGTGNDFAKLLGGAEDREGACRIIASGVVRHFDVGRVEWEGGSEFFVNGIGTGVDVEVVRQIKRLPRMPGVLSYLIGLIRVAVGFQPLALRLRLDDETVEGKLMIIAVGNGFCVGGGFYITPDAVPDDGKFDICMVDALNYRQIARVIPRVMKGTHTGLAQVRMARASTIEIEAMGRAPLFFQLDGELREPARLRHLRIHLEPRALPVLTGAAPAAPATSRAGAERARDRGTSPS